MKFPSLARTRILGGVCLLLLAAGPAAAAEDWTPALGDLGRTATRFALHIGGNWSAITGTEVEQMDSATGYEAGISVRVFRSFSLFGGYAVSSGDVKGQVVQLLDQNVRPDGRSGNVSGQIEARRFRTGIRVDALRERNWRFQPYLLGAAVFTTTEVTIDSVDQAAPRPVPVVGGGSADISRFEDSQIGALARFGVEYRVVPLIGIDFNLSLEMMELPPGTNAATSVNGGITIRI